MKKLCILLVIMLLCATNALAEISFFRVEEDFQIRNGIGLNMSRDDVKVVEEQNGSIDITSSGRFAGTDRERFLQYTTSLLGADAELRYNFSEDGILTDFYYTYNKAKKADISASLSERYGKPLFKNKDILDVFDSSAIEMFLTYQSSFSNVALREYIGWLIQYDDCYVYVDLIDFTYKNSQVNGVFYKILDYDKAEYGISRLEDYYDSVKKSKTNDL